MNIHHYFIVTIYPEYKWLANGACTNLTVALGSGGAPVYEQKELRQQRKAPKAHFANGRG